MREITKADKEGYAGFATKSTNDCSFIQRKYTDNDIFGHDSYDVYCTKTGELRKICGIVCERCSMRS
jgi:hypothetical protein